MKPITHVLGVDQSTKKSGWALARLSDGEIVYHGFATKAAHRAFVMREVVRIAGGLEHVLVMLEDHSEMPLTRLTRYDRRTKRSTAKRAGGPERGMKQAIGMGDARGRWREKLEDFDHPILLRDQVEPFVWRARLGIRGKGTAALKAEAVRWCQTRVTPPPGDHNVAEACCLAAFGVLEGLHRLAARCAKKEAETRARRDKRRQLALTRGEEDLDDEDLDEDEGDDEEDDDDGQD